MNYTIYTDGCCRISKSLKGKESIGRGGCSCIIIKDDIIVKKISKGFRVSNSSRMELMAVIVGLEALTKDGLNVLVVSDSKYVVDSISKGWVFGWEKKGFVGKKNPDLWKRFLKIYRKHQVKFQWIKGHNNHPMNERCDVLAVEASKQPKLLVDEWYEANEA